MKISACMILGPCAGYIDKTLKTIEPFVDEICLLITKDKDGKTEKAVRNWAALADVSFKIEVNLDSYLYEDGIPKDFAKMRNDSFEMASHDIVCWFDSDDQISCPDPVKFKTDVVNHFENNVQAIYARYYYGVTKSGHRVSEQSRERFVIKNGFEWRSPLHEVLCSTKLGQNAINIKEDVFHVVHMRDPHDAASNASQLYRNTQILERYFDEHEEHEVRLDFYYGHCMLDSKEYGKAVESYDRYLEVSDWPEERYTARLRKSLCLRKLQQPREAVEESFRALDELPEAPDAYLELAECYFDLNNWSKCVHWCLESLRDRQVKRTSTHNPVGLAARPRFLLREVYKNTGNFFLAHGANEELLKMFPDDPHLVGEKIAIEEELELIESVAFHKINLDKLSTIEEKVNYVRDKVDPEIAKYHGEFSRYYNSLYYSEGKRSIAFYCGHAVERWGPSSLKNGIGGSEEAVIHLSKEFCERGWHVEVFCNTDEAGWHDGVLWRESLSLNPEHDPYDVVVLWRQAEYTKIDIKAKYKCLWLHDLQNEAKFTQEVYDEVDRIFVLSDFHRGTVPYIPDSKIFVTRNGIDIDTVVFDREKNNPKRVIYASAPDRGLERVLDAWPKIISAVPDAELHVFYGFNKAFNAKCQHNKGLASWKETMIKKLQQDGVTYHGMISQSQLAQELSKSGIWAYPTPFGEISCITAMKMQAAGVIPVVSRYSAINETVLMGRRAGPEGVAEWEDKDIEEWTDLVIDTLNRPDHQRSLREALHDEAIRSFSYEGLVDDWEKVFKEGLDEHSASDNAIAAVSA